MFRHVVPIGRTEAKNNGYTMTLSCNETKRLIEIVLATPIQDARLGLNFALKDMNRTEPEFYAGVIEHGSGMSFTSEQWFDFFSKIPNRLFWRESKLMNRLSEVQRLRLQVVLSELDRHKWRDSLSQKSVRFSA